jgi:hypothetical protein
MQKKMVELDSRYITMSVFRNVSTVMGQVSSGNHSLIAVPKRNMEVTWEKGSSNE